MSKLNDAGISWLILGQRTPISARTSPKVEWLRDIVEAADNAGVPCFLKENLGWPSPSCEGSPPFYKKDHTGTWVLRQEFPKACIRLQEVTR